MLCERGCFHTALSTLTTTFYQSVGSAEAHKYHPKYADKPTRPRNKSFKTRSKNNSQTPFIFSKVTEIPKQNHNHTKLPSQLNPHKNIPKQNEVEYKLLTFQTLQPLITQLKPFKRTSLGWLSSPRSYQ